MKWYYRISGLLFILFVFGLAIAALLLPDRAYSSKEKRNLAQFPTFSMRNIADGSFMDGMEDYAADQFPMRDDFMQMKTALVRAEGKVESQGVYIAKDGSLMGRIRKMKRKR